jgi:HTH-type transcriptional regulator/antitoxin HigA
MHELGHIILGHTTNDQQQISVDMRSFNDEDENRQEREADRFASEWLIPDKLWKLAPVAPMNPFVIQKKYFSWAEKRGLNKWIVLGRLSHETGIYKFKSDDSRHVIKEGGELMK